MTTSAKAELKQGIRELSETCKRYIDEIKEKDNKIDELEEQNRAYKLNIEHEKETRKKISTYYEKTNNELKEEIQKLKNENETLNEEIQKLKNESKTTIHNERGAGRKQRLTEEQKETIKMYRVQGKTIKEIAEIFNCSIGLIHKLINESK